MAYNNDTRRAVFNYALSKQALARLRAYTPPPTQWYNCPLARRAAVLILLFPDRNGELKVVLTMRASTLRSYAGQAALPGGKSDTLAETPWATARREACEEIGLPMTDAKLPAGFQVEHLCELPTSMARTELGVRPCVAFLCPSSAPASSSTGSADKASDGNIADVEEKMIPRLDPKEVAAVFTAPFHNFLRRSWESKGARPVNKGGQPHSWYRGSWTEWHDSRWRMHNFYIPKPAPSSPSGVKPKVKSPSSEQAGAEASALEDLSTFRVFGMTARILVDAARLAYGEEPDFEHNSHIGDEDMIRRLIEMGRFSETRKEGEELTNDVLREASKI